MLLNVKYTKLSSNFSCCITQISQDEESSAYGDVTFGMDYIHTNQAIVTDLPLLAEGWYSPKPARIYPSSRPSGGVGQQMGGDGTVW